MLAVVSVLSISFVSTNAIHLIVLKQLNCTQSCGLFTPPITCTITITSEMDCLVCASNNYFSTITRTIWLIDEFYLL